MKRQLLGAIALARRDLVGAGAFLLLGLMTLAFLSVADEVAEGETDAVDAAILAMLRSPGDTHEPIGPDWLIIAAADLTALGSIAILLTVITVVGGLFVAIGKRRQALALVAASGGAVLWSQGLKALFDRARPETAFHAVEVVNASFPSGHAMLSASVYLTLGALVAQFAKTRRVRVFALAAALVVTLLVGVTRVYLGVHWPTDVIAGWIVGAAWALACWLAERAWGRLYARRLEGPAKAF